MLPEMQQEYVPMFVYDTKESHKLFKHKELFELLGKLHLFG